MAAVVPGRYTAQIEGSFVVFIIGVRVNKLWAVRDWLPIIKAMPPMLKELYTHPELGFLHAEYFITLRGPMIVQYWRSFEQLEQYARQGAFHLDAWRMFNQKVAASRSVGIYHESYLVPEGRYECVYHHMPVMGLAKAGRHVPATGPRETAARRLGGDNEPAVPSPPVE